MSQAIENIEESLIGGQYQVLRVGDIWHNAEVCTLYLSFFVVHNDNDNHD